MNKKEAEKRLIYSVISGSHAYGLNTPESDIDTRGVFIADPNNTIGFAFPVEQVMDSTNDTQYYEIKKFMKLASDCNPNIIELLAAPEDVVTSNSKYFKKIHDNIELFISKKAKHTFTGYAVSQLKRIQGHNKWINNPQPARSPSVENHMITKTFAQICAEENEKYIEYMTKKKLSDKVTYFNIDGYRDAFRRWRQYWDWKNNRNEKRAKLEQNHGFDTKHAMHLIRLLRMGIEILEGKGVIVRRPDRDELLAIRNGEVSYESIVDKANKMLAKADELYETSKLPKSSNIKKINQLTIEIIYEYWRDNKKIPY